MYGLPEGFKGEFLLHKTLRLVSFSENTVYLAFDNNVSITIYSSIEHEEGAQNLGKQTVPIRESRLMHLIGCVVDAVHSEKNGLMALSFNNGHVLRVFDDQPNYESYSISDGTKEIFV